ncbi:MAG TPA: mannosyltransferase family protein [Ktedonosporobacter sp.]|nr:mannosyltransferase family protein [Ktedonosporobacter sp.]
MKRPSIRDILGLFTTSRLLLVMVTYFGYILLTAPKYSSTPVDVGLLFNSWNHWDAANYVRIAQYGYQDKWDFAFFPLFPMIISIIAYPFALIFGAGSYVAVGMIVSNLALLGAMFVIYQIATDLLGDKVAYRTLLYLCIFPTAFFFFTTYNESLFILLSAGSFLALRRKKWWLAGVLGFLTSLTRNAGLLLVIPYLYELWLARESILTSRVKTFLGLLPIILIPLGALLYCLYCWKVTGNPVMFATVQYHWARRAAFPWQGLWQAVLELAWIQPFGSFYQAHILLDFGATVGLIILICIGWTRLRTSYSLWMIALLLVYLLSPSLDQHDSLISNQRFVIEFFPAFMTLASLGVKHPRLHQTLLMFFPALLAVLSILFVMNYWMV